VGVAYLPLSRACRATACSVGSESSGSDEPSVTDSDAGDSDAASDERPRKNPKKGERTVRLRMCLGGPVRRRGWKGGFNRGGGRQSEFTCGCSCRQEGCPRQWWRQEGCRQETQQARQENQQGGVRLE